MLTLTEKLKAITSLRFLDTLQKLETYIGITGDLYYIILDYA
jgi:hypothetical protein